MPRRSSKVTNNEPSTSKGRKAQRLEHNESSVDLSQTRIDQHFATSQPDINELVNNCVRYFVYNAGQNIYFRKADIQKQVLGKTAGHHFQQIIEKTADILKNVYGYHMLVCDPTQNSSKAFIISNAMPNVDYTLYENKEQNEDVKKILLLLILSHISMCNNSVTEASMYTFLSYLNIDSNKKHPLFGHVKDYITNTLIKQKYLSVETDPMSKKVNYSWGIRSEKEISKHEILKFICKMYKDKTPKNWGNQFQAAEDQGFENERLLERTSMDLDEE